MPRLDDFREMIDKTDDVSILESGQTLLREMIEISALKERLSNLEAGLTDGGKAIFYFFAEELDEDEIVFAAERLTGKLRRVKRAEDQKKETNNEEADEASESDEEADEEADEGCEALGKGDVFPCR